MSVRRIVVTIALCGLAACSREAASPPSAGNGAPGTAPPPKLSYDLRLGRDVFQHYCATCHGDSGAGDGFNAYNLDPHPRDLSDPALQKKSDVEIADTIRRGGAGVGMSSLMPPWGRTLSERQVTDVVLYLRTLKKSRP